jgi:hypothetical protein
MNNAFLRKLASDDLRETLMFCGLVDSPDCKTKSVDSKGKTRYVFNTYIGDIIVYGHNSIYIKGKRFPSMNQVKYELIKYL